MYKVQSEALSFIWKVVSMGLMGVWIFIIVKLRIKVNGFPIHPIHWVHRAVL